MLEALDPLSCLVGAQKLPMPTGSKGAWADSWCILMVQGALACVSPLLGDGDEAHQGSEDDKQFRGTRVWMYNMQKL